MYVVKRNGKNEQVQFDKITIRIQKLCNGLDESVDPILVAQKVAAGVHTGVTTVALDELAAQTAAHLLTQHPDYGILAARIATSNLYKQTENLFSKTIEKLYSYVESKSEKKAPLISSYVYAFVMEHAEVLDKAILDGRDYMADYFAFRTLERSYLLRLEGRTVERPQYMLMRVACGLHCGNLQATLETYQLMALGHFIHASPTLFNSGTPTPQLASCFLLTMKGDDIGKIYDTLRDCAIISKHAGGIGISVHNIRATGSYIRGTNGHSNGLVPMLRVFNTTARYVDQGGGKRKGAFAIYLEPWHADIFDFLELKKNHGTEEARARDIFYALWIPDLFMERVRTNGQWSLFCPNEAKGLAEVWGSEFQTLYEKYESAKKARVTIKAQDLWKKIIEAQQETGNPYMLYKDTCNRKSNQSHLGTIQGSNLCAEIIEYSSPDEIAVCNLASIALPKCVNLETKTFNHDQLYKIARVVTRNLNRVIDITNYPVPEARKSNLRHRPIGIGVQGLADVFILLRYPFESKEAQKLNKEIFETLYYGALSASQELAEEEGCYETYEGSPMSKGLLQFDLWKVTPDSKRWDWDALRKKISVFGVRNSLLIAPMPTATTSQILGNNESVEPYTSNLYLRRTNAGEFMCVSRHLVRDLIKLKLWTPSLRNKLIAHNGSVQKIDEIPLVLRELYKTVWEMSVKTLMNMAKDRGAFICQSESFNVFKENPTYQILTSMHFYAWELGLKTGIYYLRTKPAVDAIKFTVDQSLLRETSKETTTVPSPSPSSEDDITQTTPILCPRTSDQTSSDCLSCGS